MDFGAGPGLCTPGMWYLLLCQCTMISTCCHSATQKGALKIKSVLPTPRTILQLNYFLCCVNHICFQQVFLTAQGGNWVKLLYIGAFPRTHTDTAEQEAKSVGIIVNSMETSTTCFPNTRARYCSSPKQAAVVFSAPTSSSEIPNEHISPGWH